MTGSSPDDQVIAGLWSGCFSSSVLEGAFPRVFLIPADPCWLFLTRPTSELLPCGCWMSCCSYSGEQQCGMVFALASPLSPTTMPPWLISNRRRDRRGERGGHTDGHVDPVLLT